MKLLLLSLFALILIPQPAISQQYQPYKPYQPYKNIYKPYTPYLSYEEQAKLEIEFLKKLAEFKRKKLTADFTKLGTIPVNLTLLSPLKFAWPVKVSKEKMVVTSGYGIRYRNGRREQHRAWDLRIQNYPNTPTLAVWHGIITVVKNHSVTIKHNNKLETFYNLLTRINVRPGQRVKKGDIIGWSGGSRSNPHLHFEIRENGQKVNPKKYYAHLRYTYKQKLNKI